jgi:hypothetical protein
MDVIDINIARKNIDDTFRVGKIEEEWLTPTGQAVKTVVHTEPSP